MEGMINRTVYTINPNFRLQSNHLLVEWIMIDTFTFQQELLQHESAFIYNKGKNQIICQRYGKSLEYPPNCSRLTQQDLIIRELKEKRRSWADS